MNSERMQQEIRTEYEAYGVVSIVGSLDLQCCIFHNILSRLEITQGDDAENHVAGLQGMIIWHVRQDLYNSSPPLDYNALRTSSCEQQSNQMKRRRNGICIYACRRVQAFLGRSRVGCWRSCPKRRLNVHDVLTESKTVLFLT